MKVPFQKVRIVWWKLFFMSEPEPG
jgi:hypothetical protein